MVVSFAQGKKRPIYDIDAIKSVFPGTECLAITLGALRDALALGLERTVIIGVIQTIERRMFIKSITTCGDHRV